jgi:hypothetical protein
MTDKDFVIRSAQANRLDLIKPSKADKTILVIDAKRKPAPVAVEAPTWGAARSQLAAYLLKHYV